MDEYVRWVKGEKRERTLKSFYWMAKQVINNRNGRRRRERAIKLKNVKLDIL
jgi:hypothetical protein